MTTHAEYAYRAARRDGAVEAGVLSAVNRTDAAARLSEQGLFPIEIIPRAQFRRTSTRTSTADLAVGFRILASLLEAGLPMARALTAMDGLAPRSWAARLPAVREAVSQGKGLGAALEAAQFATPPLVLGVIRAGEAGSGVCEAVRQAADFLERSADTSRAIRNALAYPLVLLVSGGASVGLLLGVVLPRFEHILADLGQSLPPATAATLLMADVVRISAIPMILALAAGVFSLRVWTATDSGIQRWHAFLLTIPIAGPIRRSAAVAQICYAIAALLDSGVPIAASLLHAARAGGDAALGNRLLLARQNILEGWAVSRAVEAHGALTPGAARLIRAGEETGRLAAMFRHGARIEREHAEQLVRTAVRLLEPILIMIFGAVVAFIAAALLQAIYTVKPVP